MKKLLIALFAGLLLCWCAAAALADPCPETLTQTTTNGNSYLGLHPAGPRYGVGQYLTLECDYRFESIALRFGWGPAVGDVRSLTIGDTLFCDIRETDLSLVATAAVEVPDATGLRYLDFDFLPQDVLLPAGDYLITCRVSADAAGSVSYCTVCTTPAPRYINTDSNNAAGWESTSGVVAYEIQLDPNVTPVVPWAFDALKAVFR